MLENGIAFREIVLDLMGNPHPEYLAVNPLKKVPAWRLPSGELIIDSQQILNVLYARIESTLSPRPEELARCGFWSGFAVELCERLVEYFFEMHRPEATRDRETLEEDHAVIGAAMDFVEEHFRKNPRATLLEGGLRQSDLDLGTALDYVTIRYRADWQARYPHAARYLAGLSERPSFRKTIPPRA